LQPDYLAGYVDSADSHAITLSDSQEEITTDFDLDSDFFIVIPGKTAINSLIPAEILRFSKNGAFRRRLFGS